MTINYKGKELEIKYNLRSLFIYEQITKKPFSVKTLFDEYVFMYSCLLSANKDTDITFDDFIEWADENPEAFREFNVYLVEEQGKREIFKGEEEKKTVSQ